VNGNAKKLKYPGEPETFSFVLSKLGGLVYEFRGIYCGAVVWYVKPCRLVGYDGNYDTLF